LTRCRAIEIAVVVAHTPAVIARLDRAIQKSAAIAVPSPLDAPVKPGHDGEQMSDAMSHMR
jgi:hypothetical protein